MRWMKGKVGDARMGKNGDVCNGGLESLFVVAGRFGCLMVCACHSGCAWWVGGLAANVRGWCRALFRGRFRGAFGAPSHTKAPAPWLSSATVLPEAGQK